MIVSNLKVQNSALTARESEILGQVAIGNSAKQIAAEVGLAPRTVERYIENVRHKLGARNRSHLIAIAVACGVLQVNEDHE